MVDLPYKVYSSSPTDVLPTEAFTLFIMLTCKTSRKEGGKGKR